MLTGEEQEELNAINACTAENAKLLSDATSNGETMYHVVSTSTPIIFGLVIMGVTMIIVQALTNTSGVRIWALATIAVSVVLGYLGNWMGRTSLAGMRVHQAEHVKRRGELLRKQNADQN